MSKIKTREQVIAFCADARQEGKKVGYTSGAYDILHAGHVDFLTRASEDCDFLVVGLNSDSSTRALKGSARPIQSEDLRSVALEGLAAVSVVFLFDDLDNNQNIELLKPDVYFKAGDYAKEDLTSAPIIERQGGRVEIIPFSYEVSTSKIVETVLRNYWQQIPITIPDPPLERKPALFLDRDGTINKNIQYLHEPEKLEILPGVLEALREAQSLGYQIIIITNQPGIGFGYFSKEQFFELNLALLRQLSAHDVLVNGIYFCPHTEADGCLCRKPGTLLLDRAIQDRNILVEESVLIGDRLSDVQAGNALGIKTGLISDVPSEEATWNGSSLREIVQQVVAECSPPGK